MAGQLDTVQRTSNGETCFSPYSVSMNDSVSIRELALSNTCGKEGWLHCMVLHHYTATLSMLYNTPRKEHRYFSSVNKLEKRSPTPPQYDGTINWEHNS